MADAGEPCVHGVPPPASCPYCWTCSCAHGGGRTVADCETCCAKLICEHGKTLATCEECGARRLRRLCEHNKVLYYCAACGGGVFCSHGRVRAQCKECGGSAICPHGRQRAQCKECGGSAICPHGRQRAFCKECGGSQVCTHGRRKATCKECGGADLCGCVGPRGGNVWRAACRNPRCLHKLAQEAATLAAEPAGRGRHSSLQSVDPPSSSSSVQGPGVSPPHKPEGVAGGKRKDRDGDGGSVSSAGGKAARLAPAGGPAGAVAAPGSAEALARALWVRKAGIAASQRAAAGASAQASAAHRPAGDAGRAGAGMEERLCTCTEIVLLLAAERGGAQPLYTGAPLRALRQMEAELVRLVCGEVLGDADVWAVTDCIRGGPPQGTVDIPWIERMYRAVWEIVPGLLELSVTN